MASPRKAAPEIVPSANLSDTPKGPKAAATGRRPTGLELQLRAADWSDALHINIPASTLESQVNRPTPSFICGGVRLGHVTVVKLPRCRQNDFDDDDDNDAINPAMEDRSSTISASTSTSLIRTTLPKSHHHQRSMQNQAAISRLPAELLTQILNHLNFPNLSSFLNSCHLFRQFPSDAFVSRIQNTYIEDLLAKEQSDAGYREVCAGNLVRYCMQPPVTDIHRNRAIKAERLVCYTCYSELPRERFVRGQVQGTRSYGHGRAAARFCIACGVKRGKWAAGTVFGRWNGNLIVCVGCKDLKKTSGEARREGLCVECYDQGVEDRFMLDLRRLSWRTDDTDDTDGTESSNADDGRSEGESSPLSSESSVDFGSLGEKEVICRRCWIVDHTLTKVVIGIAGQPDRSLCETCAATASFSPSRFSDFKPASKLCITLLKPFVPTQATLSQLELNIQARPQPPPDDNIMSLLKLPAEVQKNILVSLDYASLCQIRSTGRYFYNFLTELEIHDVFLNINIPQGDYQRNPKDGQICFYCAGFCDGTAAQEKATERKLKLAQKQVESTEKKAMAAKQDVVVAENTLTKAKAALREIKVQKEKREKRVEVFEAQEFVMSAKEAAKTADLDLVSARRAQHGVPQSSPDLVKTCHACTRKFNGHEVPGLLNSGALTIQSVHCAVTMACSRVNHYIGRCGPAHNLEAMQKNGKICKICWKSGRRGVSSIQRRRTFIDEFGYWLRVDWLMQAEVLKTKANVLAEKSFEDIEKDKKEADAAKALLKFKAKANDEKN